MTSPRDTGFMPPQPRAEPLVLSVTEPLTQRSVAALGEMIDHTPPARTVIVDVTGISDFDSFGTSALLALQERVGPRRLVVVGIKQAAERLVAADDLQPDDGDDERGHRRPVPGIVVVTPTATTTSADLLAQLTAAVQQGMSIVAVDMAASRAPTRDMLGVLAHVGRQAAQRGQHLVLLHVAAAVAAPLTQLGLPPTTYVVTDS